MLESVDLHRLFSGYMVEWAINLGFAILIFVLGRLLARILTRVLERLLKRSGTDEMLINFLSAIAYALMLAFVVIAALQRLGVNTTSVIAVLGAAGLAVGLALKDSMQNFAAGVMLIVFRPFKAGDYVEAGGTSGVIERIGIFSTQLRTGDNREVIVPNGHIYSGTITNYSARATRRIDMVFGISYDDDLRKAKQIIKDILGGDERILADPEPLIAVAELADSSVNINVRPWVKSEDYWNVRYDLTEQIKLAFDDNAISIPFPQMDVHLPKSA